MYDSHANIEFRINTIRIIVSNRCPAAQTTTYHKVRWLEHDIVTVAGLRGKQIQKGLDQIEIPARLV